LENLLTRKLEGFGPLPEADKRLLDKVIREFEKSGITRIWCGKVTRRAV
jgi:hypothetical protein